MMEVTLRISTRIPCQAVDLLRLDHVDDRDDDAYSDCYNGKSKDEAPTKHRPKASLPNG
jgi:hypothetical protein